MQVSHLGHLGGLPWRSIDWDTGDTRWELAAMVSDAWSIAHTGGGAVGAVSGSGKTMSVMTLG